MTDAFSDEELTTICFDRFPTVYESFGSGMGKGDKIQRLLDHAVRRDETHSLLEVVKERNPVQYTRFEPHLRRVPGGE